MSVTRHRCYRDDFNRSASFGQRQLVAPGSRRIHIALDRRARTEQCVDTCRLGLENQREFTLDVLRRKARQHDAFKPDIEQGLRHRHPSVIARGYILHPSGNHAVHILSRVTLRIPNAEEPSR